MFQLTREEFDALRSQIAMSKPQNSSQIAMSSGKHRGATYQPYAFTEHGALMAANILNSPRAVQMSTACAGQRVCCASLCQNARSGLAKSVSRPAKSSWNLTSRHLITFPPAYSRAGERIHVQPTRSDYFFIFGERRNQPHRHTSNLMLQLNGI